MSNLIHADRMDLRIARNAGYWKEKQKLLEWFSCTPMAAAFLYGEIPRLPKEKATQVAGILAMCSYVTIKREPKAGVLPEMSFDAVCIWSSVIAEILCPKIGRDSKTAAVVGYVMAAQYMHILEWEVLDAGLKNLRTLYELVMIEILKYICQELLD